MSGNWDAASTWGGAGVPGDGDTATINDGVTVTIPAGYRAIIGASPADNSGTAALACTNPNTGSGQLVVNGTFTFRGRVDQCRRGAWTVGPGGVLEHDSSRAASPATAHYMWQFGTGFDTVYCTLNLNGTAAEHVTVRIAPGSGTAWGFVNNQASPGRSVKLTASYTDISDWTASGFWARLYQSNDPGVTVSLDHVNALTNNGALRLDSLCVTCGLSITNSYLKAGPSAYRGQALDIEFSGAVSGAPPRALLNSVIYGNVFWYMGKSTPTGFAIRDTVFNGAFTNSGGNFGSTMNVLSDSKVMGTGPPTSTLYGSVDGLYVLSVNTTANPHPYSFRADPGVTTISRFIYETSFRNDGEGDPIQVELSPSVPSQVTVTRSIMLPSAQGGVVGSFFNVSGPGTPANLQVTAEHNTIILQGTGGVSGFGGEANAGAPAMFRSIRSNIGWHPGAAAPALFTSYTSSPPDGVFQQVDYNWTYNTSGTVYGLTSLKYGDPSPPGAHDGSGDPQFADPSRRLALFDQNYLGAARGPEWNSYPTGQSFAVGDIVSHQVNGYFRNAAINYRCISPHTKDAGGSEPGIGNSWPVYWEYAGIETIRRSVLAGETFTDGAIGASGESMIGVLIKWVMRGFTPQNRALCAAGHDGTAPGAMNCDPMPPPVITP